jgi:hypothetical protein
MTIRKNFDPCKSRQEYHSFTHSKGRISVKKLLATVLSASLVMILGMSFVGCTPATPAKKTEPAKDKVEPAKDKVEPAKDKVEPAKDKK